MPKKDAPTTGDAQAKPSRLISVDLPLDYSERVRQAAADSQKQVSVGDLRDAIRVEVLKINPRSLAAAIVAARSAAALEALKTPVKAAAGPIEEPAS